MMKIVFHELYASFMLPLDWHNNAQKVVHVTFVSAIITELTQRIQVRNNIMRLTQKKRAKSIKTGWNTVQIYNFLNMSDHQPLECKTPKENDGSFDCHPCRKCNSWNSYVTSPWSMAPEWSRISTSPNI